MSILSIKKSYVRDGRHVAKLLKCGASLTAICVLTLSLPSFAQTPATEPAADEIIVTGIRASLANAQKIKRESDTVVDAITAQDIGALPDRSVTEALQRVPGVSINRFAGSNDPDHFSAEGSGVVIRGLNFVRSEFNGRSTFSAGVGGQAINFADVPAELLGNVQVYKNATAELIEGGLAGTVNLNLRRPFDYKDNDIHVGFSAEANYGDFRKEFSPTGSVLIGKTWNTGIGRIGLLGSLSYSRILSRADGIQVTNFQTRDNTAVFAANAGTSLTCRNPVPGTTNTTTLPAGNGLCGAANLPGADGFLDPRANAFTPIGGQFRSQDFDRRREGQAFVAQWESNDERANATFNFLRTHSTNSWGEHTFETAPDNSEYNTYPFGCQQNNNGPLFNGNGTTRAECPTGTTRNYTYDANGLFQSGYITLPGTGWRNASSGSPTSNVPTGGQQQSLSRRQVFETNTINDYGLSFRFEPSDRLSIGLDANITTSRKTNKDYSVFGSTFADQELDLTGNLPKVTPHKPLTLAASWATPNPRLVAATDAQYFADRDVQFWRAAMDHLEDSTGTEYQFAGDVAYKFDEGSFINRVKFGARYAERAQTVRYTTYNWGAISEIWSGTPVTVNQGGAANVDFYAFPDFFRGATPGPVGGYYYNGDLINDFGKAATYFKSLNDIWRNTNGATASNRWVPLAERAGVVAGTDYLPSEVQRIRQEDSNAYIMVNFGNDAPIFGDVRLSGNIGVRYVNTLLTSQGSIGVPSRRDLGIQDPFAVRCAPIIIPGGGTQTPGGICNRGAAGYAALQQFATGGSTFDIARTSYTYWLPSLNLKLGLTDDLIFRFAASKVLTRPDSAYTRNFITIGADSATGALTAEAGNPFLKPATAWQFDATLEWYFARVGSLTFNAFYKSVDNFFYQAVTNRPISNNGITDTVNIRGPANFEGKGTIKGFEAAYQHTFDFLPGLLSGFGVNANYSYIESSGLPNTFLNTGSPVAVSTIKPGNLPLEGLSKHNVNATIFYEKGPVSLRAAYNWRSRFLLTAADVIFPYTSVFNDATGQLDASIFLSLSKNIKVGVQGVNLTNEVTKTLQAYTGDPNLLAPRSFFVNDRRFSFVVRGNF
jgi:TonB-dependent receptor